MILHSLQPDRDRLKRGGFMNAVPRKTNKGVAKRIKRILVAILFAAPCFFALACRSEVLSKPPILSEFNPHGDVVRYIPEFNQMGEKGYWTPVALDHTPDQPWQVYIEQESPAGVAADFFRLRIRNNKSGDSRLVFTLWAADIGSGVAASVRWSKDAKALQIRGDTKGFSYEPVPEADPSKYESFNFIYLVDEDKIYSVPREGV